MKKLTTPLLAAVLALSASAGLSAAEPESAFGLAPATEPQILPAPATPESPSNLPLIPETPDSVAKPKAGQSSKTAPGLPQGDKTAMAEDKTNKQIALRKAKNKAEREPDLMALKVQALEAPTDFEQRKIFIDYYTKLVDRIAKYSEPKLKKEDIDTLKSSYTGRFYQTRVAPTIDPATFRTQR